LLGAKVNFWVYGVALKTAPCILLSVLSALLIRAMRAAELRHRRLVRRPDYSETETTARGGEFPPAHRRLVRRRPALSSASGTSARTDTQPSCTVRRHHEPKRLMTLFNL